MSAAMSLLSAALDSNGWICIRGLKPGSPPNQTFFAPGDYQGAVAEATRLSHTLYNAYFATSSLNNNSSGKADNAYSVKVFKLDLDVGVSVPGKPAKYETQQEAVTAVAAFCVKLGFPLPTLVNSGYGVHCYWCITEALHPDDGKLYSEKFKAITVANGLLSDSTCTADVARILRVPETFNYKDPAHPAPVKLKQSTLALHDTDVICDLIDKHYTAAGAPTLSAPQASTLLGGVPIPSHLRGLVLDEATKHLLGGKPKNFTVLLKRSQESSDKGCAQIKWASDHQASIDEPRWRAAISIARFCDDGATAIHDISRGHGEYNVAKTEEKAAHTVGPMTCAWYKNNYPTQCDGCKHTVKSPILLGEYVPRASKADNVILASPQNSNEQVAYTIPDFPFPYLRGKNGGVFRKDDADDDNAIPVMPHDFYMVTRMRDAGDGYIAHMRLHHPKDGVVEMMLNMEDTASLNDFGKILCKLGITVYGKEVDSVRSYVKSWFNYLENKEVVSVVKTQFGWSDNNLDAFVLGDREWTPRSWRPSPAAPSLANQVVALTPTGTMDMWRKTFNMFAVPGMETHAFATLIGFGSILVTLTEHDGALINLYSKDSGSGKSAAQYAALSIWGHPRTLRILATDTKGSRYHRMGVYKNLPIIVDETTKMSQDDMGEFLFRTTEGRGSERLQSSSNALRVNNTSWRTFVCSSSNTNFTQLLQSEKDGVQGELMRLVEISVPENMFSTDEVIGIFSLLDAHYGHAGPIFLQHVMQNIDRIREDMAVELKRLKAELTYISKERYWFAVGQCVLVAGQHAQEAGLHSIDMEKMREFFHDLIRKMRTRLQYTVSTSGKATDPLGEFINANNNSMLVMMIDPTTKLASETTPALGHKLVIRYERPDNYVHISCSEFRKFMRDRNGDIDQYLETMKKKGIFIEEHQVRLAKGTNRPSTPVRCFTFKLNDDIANQID